MALGQKSGFETLFCILLTKSFNFKMSTLRYDFGRRLSELWMENITITKIATTTATAHFGNTQ